MSNDEYRPSQAEVLASLIAGTGSQSHAMASVQRSHRFPLHLFLQMENLAKHANVPVSVIINELIACGLESLKRELPDNLIRQITKVTKNQTERPTVTDRFDSEKYRAKATKKRKSQAT